MGYHVNTMNHFREILMQYVPGSLIEKALQEYDKNDAAHMRDHAIDVVLNADQIIKQFPELMKYRKIILVSALLHDVKCHVNRDKHHILGALAVYREYLEEVGGFSYNDVTMIEECVLEHRASWKSKRSHDASEAVAAADRGKPDIMTYLRRAVRFRFAQLPEEVVLTSPIKEHIVRESLSHMEEKFGENGYAWQSMPKYTHLIYSNVIAEMKKANFNHNPKLLIEGINRFDHWVK